MSGEVELLAQAEVGQDSVDLLAQAEVGQGSIELLSRCIVRHFLTLNPLGKFTVRHTATPIELLGRCVIRHDGTPIELLGKAVIRHDGTPVELLGKSIVKNIGSAELLGRGIIRHEATVELLGKTVIRHTGTPVELLGKFITRHEVTIDLLGKFIARHEAAVDLLGKTIIRHSDLEELLGKTKIRHMGIPRELLGRCIIRHSDSKDLDANVEICHWEDLYGRTKIRHTATPLDLPAIFWARWPSRLWTSRRYINGVIELTEKLLGDATLEYVIDGVMEDTQGYLDNSGLSYSDWTDITLLPVQILRAVTYGTVAALYARHTQTFQSRVIPSITPVTVTVIGDAEKAMNYWEDRMDQMLEFYIESQGGDVMLTSTEDEEPVFSMADIPEEITEFVSWRNWLQRRNT